MTSRRAAQYLRMSTDRQTYSLEYQSIANGAFAAIRGVEIVRTYEDAGISGLTLSRRPGLQALLADVLGGHVDYDLVLVYDVSRWGRFQDPDQAGHYEFMCREAGVEVAYTAEPFANDGSLGATLVKHLKRAMAAEYSRDLSDRVSRTKRGLALKGYWPGGNPGLGLRRCALSPSGDLRAPMERGQANALKGERVVVVAGPSTEVELVRKVFAQFVETSMTPNALARALNAEGALAPHGRPWTQVMVRRTLSNELYTGVRVVGRARAKFGRVERRPEQEWTRVTAAAEAIVPQALFRAAQAQLRRRIRWTDAELLAGLQTLMSQQGKLSYQIIQDDMRIPAASLYARRFGGLLQAYDRVGYVQTPEQQQLTQQIERARQPRRATPSSLPDSEVLQRLCILREAEGRLSLELIEVTPGVPRVRNLLKRFGSIAALYEKLGYEPTPLQRRSMARRAISRAKPPPQM